MGPRSSLCRCVGCRSDFVISASARGLDQCGPRHEAWQSVKEQKYMAPIYYYTPLPLSLANNKQATSNTSPFCFGDYFVPPLRALLYSSHLIP